MLVRPCVVLDGALTVSEVIARLARQGYWLDSAHPVVRAVIEESAEVLNLPVETVANQLARPFSVVGVAIRRQWYANILWYARPVIEVMVGCYEALDPDQPVFLALDLHEEDSLPLIATPAAGEVPEAEGIVYARGVPVAVALENWGAPVAMAAAVDAADHDSDVRFSRHAADDAEDFGELFSLPASRSPDARASASRGASAGFEPAPPPRDVRAWPRIDAPDYVPAHTSFNVVVGLAMSQQAGVTGGEVVFVPPPGKTSIDVEVALVADGVELVEDSPGVPMGWSRVMTVDVDHPATAQVTFKLKGLEPDAAEPARLVQLEVRYSYDGSVCGTASRRLVIGRADAPDFDLPTDHGTPWLDQPHTASSISVKPDPDAADLTIEIFKPDGNPGKGSYVCRLTSPHALTSPRGPFRIELDDDAMGFAKMIVNQVRAYSSNAIVDNLLVSHGKRIARALGSEVITALREVADCVKPAPPTVLLVSAEPYVPWELAYLDPPLDASRPYYLGAQAIVGRWLRERTGTSDKPPVLPPARISIKHMAVMAGMYKAESGLNNLPEAEAEAKALQKTYDALPLAASLQAVKQLLDARLEHNFERIGGVEAIHFAGHGDYDPTTPDSAVLYLSDGTPLFASLFGSAQYGGAQSPVFFLNACMAGIGDELLGDAGGFPGNCLDGGFGAMLGALWEIDDKVAHQLAIRFWQRVMPIGGGQPEPVGAVLRDLRALYVPDPVKAPTTTYLAYVYYGHPRLTLQMAP
ncbi:MAG: CHAT domain-containing protein [Thiobacillus sp.]